MIRIDEAPLLIALIGFAKTLGYVDRKGQGEPVLPFIAEHVQQLRSQLAAVQAANKAAKDFMDYLRANVGVTDEWPVELKVAEDAIEPINTLLNQFEKTIYATDTTALDAAIAAAQQPLVAALERHKDWMDEDGMRSDGVPIHDCDFKLNPESGTCEFHELYAATLDALAKVKEGK